MHETAKFVLINNFYFLKSHCDACLECFQLATDYPYAIALKINLHNGTSSPDGQAEPKIDQKIV